MKIVPSALVRNAIADLMLPALRGDDGRLGQIQLHSHQVDGIERIAYALKKFRGALLCDEVGLGKTFTAAGVIRRFESTIVVAPAALIPMWTGALEQASIGATLLSTEKFSRADIPSAGADLIVVDEAHHFRNVHTRRFINLSRFIGNARTLLLTATPVHNSHSDLVALLSLFLGSRANALTPAEFAECVIRREKRIIWDTFPRRVTFPAELVHSSDTVRAAILSLPPPIPPSDGDDCSTLVQFTLLRQWASSSAALRSGLTNRIARARALAQALEAGTYPTRNELDAWLTGGMDIQLGFPEFLATPGGATELLDAVQKHEDATLSLYRLVQVEDKSDDLRIKHLLDLRTKYPDRKIIAFTQFASTAHHLFTLLRTHPAVALITAQRCRIASGPVQRAFVIRCFAPIANGLEPPPVRENISLLIATDLCSEGLNLQDATVIVHLDVPWTPARMEQRVGRIARPGGPRPEIFIHSIVVPAIADDVLRMGERLRHKSAAASAAIGRTFGDAATSTRHLSVPEASESIIRSLYTWKASTISTPVVRGIVAEVAASMDCFVAVVTDGQTNSLLCGSGEQVSNDPRIIISHIDALFEDDSFESGAISSVLGTIDKWLEQQLLGEALGVRPHRASSRRRIARQIETVTSRFPLHLRVTAALLADAARNAVLADCNAAGEEKLALLGESNTPDDTWLREVVELGGAFGKRKAEPMNGSGFQVLALLVGRKR